jgi:hypothetical protein
VEDEEGMLCDLRLCELCCVVLRMKCLLCDKSLALERKRGFVLLWFGFSRFWEGWMFGV